MGDHEGFRVDMSVFDVLSYPNLFHNLKAAIKDACSGKDNQNLNIYYEDTQISPKEMLEIIKNKEFSRFPENMSGAAREAYETLLAYRRWAVVRCDYRQGGIGCNLCSR